MKIEVNEKREVPLLSRSRITLTADFQGPTPSREAIRKEVAREAKSDEKLVIVKHVYTRFGKPGAKIIAHVYKNEKDLNDFEEKVMLKKHVKEEGAPAEAKKEEEVKE